MTPCSYSELFDALATSGIKAVLRNYFTETSCINTTRVLLEVFRAYGLAASAFPVRCMIFSRKFIERADREGRLPEGEAEIRSWCAEDGVYSVGIGFGAPGMAADRWPGHLVIQAGKHYMLDATVDQASRPARGICLPEMVLLDSVPLDFWRGGGAAVTTSPDGSAIRYEPDPANTSYRDSPGWQLRPHVEGAVFEEILWLLQRKGGLPAIRRKEGVA